jgi:hypothetical protein
MFKKISIAILMIIIIFFIVQFIISISTNLKINGSKNEDFCSQNKDCVYVWYTGACHTSEYVDKVQKESETAGIRNGEVPSRENVTCTCQSNKCVTHN